MGGKFSIPARIGLPAAVLVMIFLVASSVQAYRICTFKGTVINHGWRSMTVKSGRQCAKVNVGWRTKYIPNRRPCLGERVAVDFILEEGYMKATKVVSLTPVPAPKRCYPPPPPSSATCRTVAEKRAPECTPPKAICSQRTPPHVSDKAWSPRKKKPRRTKRAPKKTAISRKKVAAVTPTDRKPPELKEEKKEPAPIEEKRFKELKGEVVASSPKSLSIRVTEQGETAEVINVKVGLKTKFIPFRRPAVGERVKVDYRQENGGKFGYTVQVIQ